MVRGYPAHLSNALLVSCYTEAIVQKKKEVEFYVPGNERVSFTEKRQKSNCARVLIKRVGKRKKVHTGDFPWYQIGKHQLATTM